jgi:hypothetical protein
MAQLVEELFGSFTTVIESLAGGIKNAFTNLIYVDPAATSPEFSPVVVFVFVMAGIGLATGILYRIFSMIRARKG